MKFLSALLLAGTAAALPQYSSSGPAKGFFNLTDFSFSGSRGSISIFYRFDISETLSGASTSCSWSTTSTPDFIPFDYVPCEDPTFSFAWRSVELGEDNPGWSLQITRSTSNPTNETACQQYPASDIKQVQDPNPNLDYSYLDAPQAFLLPWDLKGKDGCVFH